MGGGEERSQTGQRLIPVADPTRYWLVRRFPTSCRRPDVAKGLGGDGDGRRHLWEHILAIRCFRAPKEEESSVPPP